MFAGQLTYCLNSKNLEATRRYYEALGFVAVWEVPEMTVVLNNGDCDIALMTFLKENCLNYRGADVFAVKKFLDSKGIHLEGAPESYKAEDNGASADGVNWLTKDVDGNNLFFDTNEGEMGSLGQAHALRRVLDCAERQFILAGVGEACLSALRSEITKRWRVVPQR